MQFCMFLCMITLNVIFALEAPIRQGLFTEVNALRFGAPYGPRAWVHMKNCFDSFGASCIREAFFRGPKRPIWPIMTPHVEYCSHATFQTCCTRMAKCACEHVPSFLGQTQGLTDFEKPKNAIRDNGQCGSSDESCFGVFCGLAGGQGFH